MIQNDNRLSPEDEAKLASYLLEVHDQVEKLQLLYKFFKFSAQNLIEIFNSDPDAYDNLDTLLYLYFAEKEMLLDEICPKLEQARRLMRSRRHS